MPDATIRAIDVYPYRRPPGGPPRFLLLRRAAGIIYAGQWRMVGGKIRPEEAAWQTALRELQEETGQRPARLWSVPSVNTFYEWQHDHINLVPAFAAELTVDPVLDDEHDAFAWLSAAEACNRLAWPEQQRLLQLVATLLEQPMLPPELFIDVPG